MGCDHGAIGLPVHGHLTMVYRDTLPELLEEDVFHPGTTVRVAVPDPEVLYVHRRTPLLDGDLSGGFDPLRHLALRKGRA